MALAIIGGQPERFRPFVDLHRRGAEEVGLEPPRLSINSHGYIAETRTQALDESFPYVSAAMNRIGRERGWPPMQRPDYDAAATLRGANFVGTAEDVVEKILFQHELFGHDRFLLQFTIGGLPHEGILRSIELLGREVAPRVREEVARRGTDSRIAEPAVAGDNAEDVAGRRRTG
jgi:alkanesulfonate monooxygenase SsuD/methylene tetrahydromethanopterin reductase-like flavin-dependent oxidoreductase (luciferase family)